MKGHTIQIVRQWREQNDHTQADLARACDVHPTAISKLENGRNGMDTGTFYRVVRYTGIDPLRLLVELFEPHEGFKTQEDQGTRRKRVRSKRRYA